jgi:hypothetical protein
VLTSLINDQKDGLFSHSTLVIFKEIIGILLAQKVGRSGDIDEGSVGHASGDSEQNLSESKTVFPVDDTGQVGESNVSSDILIKDSGSSLRHSDISLMDIRSSFQEDFLVLNQVVEVLNQGFVVLDLFIELCGVVIDLSFDLIKVSSFDFISRSDGVLQVSQKLFDVFAVVDWELEFGHGGLDGGDLAFQILASLDEVGIGTSEMTLLGVLIQELKAFKLSNLIKNVPSVFLGGHKAEIAH